MMPPVTRAVAVAAAAVVAAWFALGVLQSTSVDAARDRLAAVAHPSRADADQTRRLLDRAGWLNPDEGVDIERAHLTLQLHGPAASTRALLAVARREPQNVAAWAAVALVAGGEDPSVQALALRRIRDLDPYSSLVRSRR